MFYETNTADVILTTSPIECQLVYKTMWLALYTLCKVWKGIFGLLLYVCSICVCGKCIKANVFVATCFTYFCIFVANVFVADVFVATCFTYCSMFVANVFALTCITYLYICMFVANVCSHLLAQAFFFNLLILTWLMTLQHHLTWHSFMWLVICGCHFCRLPSLTSLVAMNQLECFKTGFGFRLWYLPS